MVALQLEPKLLRGVPKLCCGELKLVAVCAVSQLHKKESLRSENSLRFAQEWWIGMSETTRFSNGNPCPVDSGESRLTLFACVRWIVHHDIP